MCVAVVGWGSWGSWRPRTVDAEAAEGGMVVVGWTSWSPCLAPRVDAEAAEGGMVVVTVAVAIAAAEAPSHVAQECEPHRAAKEAIAWKQVVVVGWGWRYLPWTCRVSLVPRTADAYEKSRSHPILDCGDCRLIESIFPHLVWIVIYS